MPKMKAGPALLQNTIIRPASASVRIFMACTALTDCAPTGYPPSSPVSKIDSLPSGIPVNLLRGRSNGRFRPVRPEVSIMDSTKNGSSEGITDCRQISIPILAPEMAVGLSKISITMAIDVAIGT